MSKTGKFLLMLVLAACLISGRQTNAQSPDNSPAVPAVRANDGAHSADGSSILEQAQAALVEEQRVNQDAAATHYDLGAEYFGKWKLDLAEVELEEAIMYMPDMKIAHRDLCLVELFRGHMARCFAEFLAVVGLGEPVPFTEQEKQELNQKALKLHYYQGLQLAYSGKWQEGLQELVRAQYYDKDDARLVRSIAFAYANLGEFEQAEKQYTASFAMDPDNAFGHADFAEVLAEKGQGGKAMQQLSQAVKLAPNAAALHVDLGWMAESSGDMDTAGREFQQAISLAPNHAGLWAHLGKIREQQGKSTEALSAYEKALAIDPAQDEAKQRLSKLKEQAGS